MSNFYQVLGVAAGVIGLLAYIPYIASILKGETKPNKASWFIWAFVGGLLAFSYISAGDENTAWLPLGYFIGSFITALLSIRYGYAIWTKLDTICVVAALISVVPWLLTHNATVTLVINVFIDFTGAIPTIIKSYREPETEEFSSWFIFLIASTLEIIAISDWNNLTVLYPVYLFILAAIITVFILRGKIKKKLPINQY